MPFPALPCPRTLQYSTQSVCISYATHAVAVGYSTAEYRCYSLKYYLESSASNPFSVWCVVLCEGSFCLSRRPDNCPGQNELTDVNRTKVLRLNSFRSIHMLLSRGSSSPVIFKTSYKAGKTIDKHIRNPIANLLVKQISLEPATIQHGQPHLDAAQAELPHLVHKRVGAMPSCRKSQD